MKRLSRTRAVLGFGGMAALAAIAAPAHAGISYTLDRAAAAPGTTVRVQAVYFNDGSAGARWQPPRQLILQWRAPNGQIIRTPAQAESDARDLNIPVNNFARMSWSAVVPAEVHGLQAVSIEGEPALMALDTGTGGGTSVVASRPATVPVVDPTTGQPLPAPEVAAAGASPAAGPAPTQAASDVTPADPNRLSGVLAGLSEYQPMYFDIRTRDRTTARFQVSFKYRLFTPDASDPKFWDKLYLGYTQTSLWDLQGESRPFIDTTFNPSLFWLNDNMWTSQSQNWRAGLQAGVEHMSNGKAGADSRSVNDAFLQPAINYRFDGGSTLTFSPRIKGYFGVADENADYSDYAGHVDWNLRWAQDNGLIASAMYRQGASSRRTTQLDLAWPLKRTWLNMNGYVHLQYFNGYGETLLGYDQRHRSQIGIGFSLVQ
ncbi:MULTISPECIES: phospholipase A [unclassified Achromobacter]|uniref:phospholipase A n=1 Tax=unclassified Achromobacter TaxID=2626865 RepID=UPI000B519D68|nr:MULTISPECIES: phospholipase A [unclassified Achromobacter]OWT69149.1 phospholipase [Achromobacter sp. HZ34]OWT70554.1 phospholipase [Achromobacter sp. HZ28]